MLCGEAVGQMWRSVEGRGSQETICMFPMVVFDAQARRWYCEIVKNVTVSLPDEIHRRARMTAAKRGTSLSALVREFLVSLGSGENKSDRLKREERDLRDSVTAFRASDRLSRDEVHRRRQ
jgi:plasmid stability protein